VTSSYVGFLRASKMQFESWGKGSSCLLCFSIPLGFFRKASSSLFESKELPLGFTRDRLFQKFVYLRNFPVLQAVFLKRLFVTCHILFCGSVTKLCPTLHDLMDCSPPGSSVLFTNCQSFLRFKSSESVMLSNPLTLCRPLLLLPLIFPHTL